MADFSLNERFPDMKPVNSPPSLGTVNGVGMTVCGSRDYDPDTGTYVKTHCLCVLFIPVLAVGAYRVADAPAGGWYFLGKVPLSGFARLWNYLLFGGAALGVAVALWLRHTSTPEYAARQKMAEAERLAEARQIGQAARLYAQVANGRTPHAGEAADRINALLDLPAGAAAPEAAAEAFQVAAELTPHWEARLPRVYERGVALAEAHAADRPAGALRLLDALALVAPDPARLAEKQAVVLEKLVAAEPDNLDHACRLALAYEARKDLERCEKLLAPHAAKLGDREGARILGVVRLRQGQLDEAQRLLTAYTEPRLEKLQELARKLQEAERDLQERALQELRSGHAAGFDFDRLKRAPEDERRKMVDDYIIARFKDDEGTRAARAAVTRERNVVGAALDLGMVLLARAQKLPPEGRREALVNAEKTFLAVRGVAGPAEEVNLNLGEVYYWLGKQAEGKKLFDDLVKGRAHEPQVLLRVGRALRRVGEQTEARRLAELAYESGTLPKDKEAAADFRSVLATDLDDRITWLRRADLKILATRADLSAALGQKAARDGHEEEAVRHLREAAAEYDRLPPNAANLNNGALVHASLYRLSGDPGDFARASRMMDRALAHLPGDSILLINAGSFALDAAVHEVAGEALDLKALRGLTGLHLLPYLFKDQAGRDRVAARLRAQPALARAVQHYERLLILAPKDALVPMTLSALYAATRDVAALRGLEGRVRAADLDLQQMEKETLDLYRGKNLEKQRADHTNRVAQRRKDLEAARKAGGATQALAAAELVLELSRADVLGLPLDADELVRLAEEAERLAPSRGARTSLVAALLVRAGQALATQDKEYAAWAAKARLALGHSYLVALALSEGGAPGAASLKNADVRRVLELVRQERLAYADESSPWAWALLRAAHPADAARLVKMEDSDELGRLLRALSQKVGAVNAAAAVTQYWDRRMAGDEAGARAALRRAAARGVPLPFDAK